MKRLCGRNKVCVPVVPSRLVPDRRQKVMWQKIYISDVHEAFSRLVLDCRDVTSLHFVDEVDNYYGTLISEWGFSLYIYVSPLNGDLFYSGSVGEFIE